MLAVIVRSARVRREDQTTALAATLGVKLYSGFGILAVGILVIAAVATRATNQISHTLMISGERGGASLTAAGFESASTSMQSAVRRFLLDRSDAALHDFSLNAATCEAQLARLHQVLGNSSQAAMQRLEEDLSKYEACFTKLVTATDARDAVTESQCFPAANRVTLLVESLVQADSILANSEARSATSDANSALMLARISFFKYLLFGTPALETAAQESARTASQALAKASSQYQEGPERRAYAESSQAIEFWASQMLIGSEFRRTRDKLADETLPQLGTQLSASAANIGAELEASLIAARADASKTASAGLSIIGWSSGVVALGALLVAFFITKSVTSPIARVVESIQHIASGDLTQRTLEARAHDEVGRMTRAVNGMSRSLASLVGEVQSGAGQIDAGAAQISAASQSLAVGASNQAASLQEVSASMEQMAAMTDRSAAQAREASSMSDVSRDAANKGQAEMRQMAQAMTDIKDSSSHIATILKEIDAIAFQTNLLALNAAVEAARAGDAGAGFAVVAEEVRSLAQRSADAARSTATMIGEATSRADRGQQIAARVDTALGEITAATTQVNAMLTGILAASDEQAKGISEVNAAITSLDRVTQQTAGNSEELAAGAEETAAQVTSLKELVSRFKVG